MAVNFYADYDLGICDCWDTNKLVFVNNLDYWETTIDEPIVDELILDFNEFLEENA